jgi:hypothetical protein
MGQTLTSAGGFAATDNGRLHLNARRQAKKEAMKQPSS